MRTQFANVVLATGVSAALGVGVWNALEVRQLREQLTVRPAENHPAEATNTAATTLGTDAPAFRLPPYTVAPPDILQIEVSSDVAFEQTLRGQHLVRADGTISLGSYGRVTVEGLTLLQVKAKIAAHLRKFIPNCSIDVEVEEFNSRAFYVISSSGGPESMSRFPFSGNETVVDAVAMIGGFPRDERKVWIARRRPSDVEEILPVDWKGITQRGHTRTNYQLLPDDRVYVKKAE